MAMPSEFSDWSPATRVEDSGRDRPGVQRAGSRRMPVHLAERDDALHGVEPAGRPRRDRHLGLAAAASPDAPWGAPENVGAPVNSAANDFCPTIDRNDHSFYFVSNRDGGCGGADIYMTRRRPDGWDALGHPGCGVNSAVDEASPFPLPEPGKGKVLYFSSVRTGGFAADAGGRCRRRQRSVHERTPRRLVRDAGAGARGEYRLRGRSAEPPPRRA